LKILIVSESFSSKLSGGKVARYLHKTLAGNGHDVKVAITSPPRVQDGDASEMFATQIHIKRRYYWRLYSLFNRAHVPEEFANLISKFSPDIVHFASFDHSKPANLYRYCKKRNIKVVLQPWTMHFYCAQGFGFREGKSCTLCIDQGLRNAMTQGCIKYSGFIGQFERYVLRKTALQVGDIYLSSNDDLTKILESYGAPKEKIKYFPVIFDVNRVEQTKNTKGDSYVYYGQGEAHKGIDFIIELFSRLPDKKLKIYPMAEYKPKIKLTTNIEILTGVGWENGLREAVANAKAILVPSLWKTSTEYSLCEAMAMKKPVIAFDVGAHRNILDNKRTAMVVELNNEMEFLQALDELDSNQELYKNIAEAASKSIGEINSKDKIYKELMNAYGMI